MEVGLWKGCSVSDLKDKVYRSCFDVLYLRNLQKQESRVSGERDGEKPFIDLSTLHLLAWVPRQPHVGTKQASARY